MVYFIRLSPGSKVPLHAWGGYDQDFDDADHVLDYDEVMEDDHTWYGYVGHKTHELGIVDLDMHKDAAPAMADVSRQVGQPLIKSPSGGFHIPFLIPEGDPRLRVKQQYDDWIDLKGEIAKGHAVFPGPNTDYQIVKDHDMKIFSPEAGDHGEVVKVRDDPALEIDTDIERRHADYTGPSYGSVYELLDPEQYPEGERVAHPYHESSTGRDFMVDEGTETFRCWAHEATGNLLHLLGMHHGIVECGEWTKGGLGGQKKDKIRELAGEKITLFQDKNPVLAGMTNPKMSVTEIMDADD